MVQGNKLEKGKVVGHATYGGEDKGWYHRYKELKPDRSIRYGTKMHFATAEEANDSWERMNNIFESAARKNGLLTTLDGNFSFVNYLKYFAEEILFRKCEISTKTVFSITLYKHIITSVDEDRMLYELDKKYINEILKKTETYSKSAPRKCVEFLTLALKHAKFERRIENIPDFKKYPRDEIAINVPNKAQLRILVEEFKKSNFELEFSLAVFSGMRKGEILGAKIEDLCRDDECIFINRQIGYIEDEKTGKQIKAEKPPKSEASYRYAYIPKRIWTLVDKRIENISFNRENAGSKYIDNGYLCCQKNGETLGLSTLNETLTKICKRRGLPHFTVHGLRHCYATILLEQGYDIDFIAGCLGHESINTTFEYYCAVMDNELETQTQWDNLLEEKME